jgi:hypothetical protein
MTNTELNFIAVNNYKTCKSIVFIDASDYNPDVEITQAKVIVDTPMGYSCDLSFYPKKINKFNSNSLKITNVTNTNQLTSLPSGLYKFNFSICPNEQIKQTVNYFNVCIELKQLADIVCCLNESEEKELTHIKKLIENLHYVKTYAEICNDVKKAKKLYDYTVKEINRLSKAGCGCY